MAMTNALFGRHILVVEDEYLIADDLRDSLVAVGAAVIGPIATVAEAIDYIEAGNPLDGAILDINLRGNMIFPVADALRSRGEPFIFATGYDSWSLPERFSDVPLVQKPVRADSVADSIGLLIARH
jgi:DNA-binding response OmpR family regulator